MKMKFLLALAAMSGLVGVAHAKITQLNNISSNYSQCSYNDANNTAICTLRDGSTKTYKNIISQCGSSAAPQYGEKIGELPQSWGSPCKIWRETNAWGQ